MDSSEQDESSFEEVDVAEMEDFAENNPGEPGENTDNTEQGVGMLPLWFFIPGVKIWQS